MKPGNSVEDKTPTTGKQRPTSLIEQRTRRLRPVNHTFDSMSATRSGNTQASRALTGVREVADERRG